MRIRSPGVDLAHSTTIPLQRVPMVDAVTASTVRSLCRVWAGCGHGASTAENVVIQRSRDTLIAINVHSKRWVHTNAVDAPASRVLSVECGLMLRRRRFGVT
jgi:hypothetical protein